MENCIPKFWEREREWKKHSQFLGTGTGMKKSFPIFGNGNRRPVFPGMVRNGNSCSPLLETKKNENFNAIMWPILTSKHLKCSSELLFFRVGRKDSFLVPWQTCCGCSQSPQPTFHLKSQSSPSLQISSPFLQFQTRSSSQSSSLSSPWAAPPPLVDCPARWSISLYYIDNHQLQSAHDPISFIHPHTSWQIG